MILFKIPPVIPTRILWLTMLFLIGVLGLIAQVSHPVQLLSSPHSLTVLFSTHEDPFDDGTSMRNSRPRYSRGLYLGISSVFALSECISVSTMIFATGCLRRYVRVYHLSYRAFSSLDRWGVDHHELVYLYYRNLTLSHLACLLLTFP